jgi:hypothetical protein
MKDIKFPKNSFIKGYFIKPKICDELIKFFKKVPNNYKPKGSVRNSEDNKIIRNDVKESTDYGLVPRSGVYPFTEYEDALQECLNNYMKCYTSVNLLSKFNVIENLNIQHYEPGGGYKVWHFERMNLETLRRNLVFMTYLNDVPDGGTDFKYQNITAPAQKGLTLIWPSDWTHTHRSQVSQTSEKYIITGWYSIER